MCNKNTGGILNKIATEKHSVSAKRTVKVMDLIKFHKPTSEINLIELLETHSQPNFQCKCNCKSSGTLEYFAQMLHKDVLWYEKENNINVNKTYDDCYVFMYNLFITNSLNGNKMEQDAVRQLSLLYPDYTFEQTDANFDLKYSVDIVIKKNGKIVAGVQVKPESYLHTDKKITSHNDIHNNNFKIDYNASVYYLYYDNKSQFTNIQKMQKK